MKSQNKLQGRYLDINREEGNYDQRLFILKEYRYALCIGKFNCVKKSMINSKVKMQQQLYKQRN